MQYTSIKNELKSYIEDKIADGVIEDSERDDWHNMLFNTDYYIIGRFDAKQWLEQHEVSAFDAIATIVEYESDRFGEVTTDVSEPEKVVNMLTYIIGEEILSNADADTVNELLEYVS